LQGSPFKNSLTAITPWFWNGLRWQEAQNIQLGRKFPQKEFTVLSWNVWFGMRNRGPRMDALGKVVQECDPDLIAFQEITADIMALITSQKWAKEYYVTDPEAKLVEKNLGYGNVMLSKMRFHECAMKNLDTRMGRKAMLGTCIVKSNPQLSFGTFHLESHTEDAPVRKKQLQAFKDLTEVCSHVILIGDTNFTSDSESKWLGPRFKDVWQEIHQKTKEDEETNQGLTFDTVTNKMCAEEYKNRNLGEKRKRLDRCFFTHETIEPISVRILGLQPYIPGSSEYISDHYGIVAKLRFKDVTQEQLKIIKEKREKERIKETEELEKEKEKEKKDNGQHQPTTQEH